MTRYYITTPIYYVNALPHIGHIYTTCAAGYIASFLRKMDYKVRLLTGTDEHGQKIEKAAHNAGLDPQTFTDQLAKKFKQLAEVYNVEYEDFIRTSEDRHKTYVQKIWKQLEQKGHIYLGKHKGWYAVRDEAFYNDDEIVDGKAPTGAEVELVEEENYFFKLSEWQDVLLKFYEDNPDFIKPASRRNEVIEFVKSGLKDLSISRTSFKWGIPVPGDEKHVIYVWLDALFNYLSAIQGMEVMYWPCKLHLVGKDILRFHAIYWPAFLLALDIKPPHRVFAHGWWTSNGQKMSKSLGNVLDPFALVEKFGSDYMKYFMMREITFGSDGNFSEENLMNRINAELVNNIGNLAQRVLSFLYNNCEAIIPKYDYSEPHQDDIDLLLLAYTAPEKMHQLILEQNLNASLNIVIELSTKANEYIARHPFWELKKKDSGRMQNALYILLEAIRVIAILLQPITPIAAAKILDQLNMEYRQISGITLHKLQPDRKINEPHPVFTRL